MKKNLGKLIAVGACWGLLLLMLVNSRPVDVYVREVKGDSFAVMAPLHGDDEQLRLQIEEWRKGREYPAIDARIDRIWKAIPGLNGRVIDVEASLEAMRKLDIASPDQLVYREVPPAITLEKLGAYPLYRGNEQKPMIGFMINVAWGNEHLDAILNTLDHYKIKTTFFLDGSWVKRFPEEAKKIAARGHEIGNHAYSHPDMRTLSAERIRQEIGKTQAMIKQTLGVTPHLFAPPSGYYRDEVVKIAHNEFKMKTILWTADTVDWSKPPLNQMLARVGGKMGNGVLVLMHPTPVTEAGLESMIKQAMQKGLTPTTVSEVISEKRAVTP